MTRRILPRESSQKLISPEASAVCAPARIALLPRFATPSERMWRFSRFDIDVMCFQFQSFGDATCDRIGAQTSARFIEKWFVWLGRSFPLRGRDT